MACLRLELVPPANNTQRPHPRSGHRLVVDEGNLYALGGYNPDVVDSDVEDREELLQRIFVQMWKFNFFTRQWKELQMMGECPKYLASHTASIHGNTLFTFGGSGIPFGIVSSQDVHVCHIDSESSTVHWRCLAVSGDIPERKYGHSQILLWPYFYIVGGTTGFIYNADVHRLDLRTCVWQCIFNSQQDDDIDHPIGRYRHELVLHNNKFLMIGGGQARAAYTLDKIPCFDLSTEKWSELHTTPVFCERKHVSGLPVIDEREGLVKGIPPARRCHSCVQYKNAVYVFGGRNEEEVLGDLWRLCLDSLQWSCLIPSSNSPLKCFFHSAAVTNSGCMYIFGGVTKPSNEVRINDIYKVWLDVPALQELAWNVLSDILHSCRTHVQESDLMIAGVPVEFTQRVRF